MVPDTFMWLVGIPVTHKMSNCIGEEGKRSSGEDDHLDEVADGAGCTEIWETLSEQRAED